MKIVDVVCSAGRTGFYFDDQRAIKGGADHDGFTYVGSPVTPASPPCARRASPSP